MERRSSPTRVLVRLLLLGALVAKPAPANATCAGGFSIYLAGQIPDFTFTSGVPAETHFNPWYASVPSNSGSCGIFARSTTPGVFVRETYGCAPEGCRLAPPGEWVSVGSAYQTFFDQVMHKADDIPVVFDGSAPPGTYGTIEIRVSNNDHGDPGGAIIAKANVYIESDTPPPTWFDVTSTEDNTTGDRVVIDHPYVNDKPGANLFVSHLSNPGGTVSGTTWNHPIGVSWDPFSGRWSIRNLDGFPMPAWLTFGVRVDPTADLYCTSSWPAPYTSIDIFDWRADNNVWATILVTPIDGAPHPVAVRYQAPHWQIVHSDGAAIPPGTCFNVQIFSFTQYMDHPASGDLSARSGTKADWGTGEDVGGNGTGHNWGQRRNLQFDWALGRPSSQLMTTYNATPMGWAPYFEARYFGVQAPSAATFGDHWSIYREDGTTMSVGARFNTWAPCAASVWYPDADGDGWGVDGVTQTSCGPVAGYAARGGDCDDADATRYPGSPEVNDGRDNQCPGEPGSGQVDEIGTIVFADPSTLCWPEQSAATGYEIVRSDDPSFESCALWMSTTGSCGADESSMTPGEVRYYLVRASHPWAGSFGSDSTGTERTPGCP